MRGRVYLETTVVSYLISRPSRDLVIAARQQITRDWWDHRRGEFDAYVSELVIREARGGDPEAARRRLEALEGIELLGLKPEVLQAARSLTAHGPIPTNHFEDAMHIALAAVHAVDYLLTWNCSHIANAQMRSAIAESLDQLGHNCPAICTPEELMGEWHDEP